MRRERRCFDAVKDHGCEGKKDVIEDGSVDQVEKMGYDGEEFVGDTRGFFLKWKTCVIVGILRLLAAGIREQNWDSVVSFESLLVSWIRRQCSDFFLKLIGECNIADQKQGTKSNEGNERSFGQDSVRFMIQNPQIAPKAKRNCVTLLTAIRQCWTLKPGRKAAKTSPFERFIPCPMLKDLASIHQR